MLDPVILEVLDEVRGEEAFPDTSLSVEHNRDLFIHR
jgi:hypothetical protein